MRCIEDKVRDLDPGSFEPGSLVRHLQRPGVWRVVGVIGREAEIEPWDDQAAGAFHAAEAYAICAKVPLLRRLVPGRAAASCGA